MKKKKIALFLIIALCVSTTAFAADLKTDSNVNNDALLESVYESVPSDVFGGLYFTDDGKLVVNVTDDSYLSRNAKLYTSQSSSIIVNKVKYTLAELEAMKESIVPYMIEYNISSLDADEVNNSVNIVMYEDIGGINQLIKNIGSIDESIVNITVTNEPIANTVATEPPEKCAFGSLDDSQQKAAATVTIYPGYIIKVGTVYGTAGPRLTSTAFYTAGHMVTGSTLTPSVYYGSTLIGQVSGTIIFGSQGDNCRIAINSTNAALPSTSKVSASATGTYTLAWSAAVGTTLEMRGGVSGVSSGKVTATNQTVNVSGTTVGRLTKTSYTCQSGDSGGGVFSTNAAGTSSVKCYGIQSAGSSLSGTVYRVSYFGPAED